MKVKQFINSNMENIRIIVEKGKVSEELQKEILETFLRRILTRSREPVSAA